MFCLFIFFLVLYRWLWASLGGQQVLWTVRNPKGEIHVNYILTDILLSSNVLKELCYEIYENSDYGNYY